MADIEKGSAYVCDVTGDTTKGYVASITLYVDPTAAPCLIGISSGVDAGSSICDSGIGGFPGGGPPGGGPGGPPPGGGADQ